MFDSQIIKQEYERSIAMISEDPFDSEKLICYADILKAHFLIIDFFSSSEENITYGVKDMNLLGSTLGRQIAGFGNYTKWKTYDELCATLFYGIIKNHAFHDANKRTALLTLIYHLLKFGRVIDVKQKYFEDLAVKIASNSLTDYKKYKASIYKSSDSDADVKFIADFIRSNTREIDKKYYPVTYHEFDNLLRKYGFYLEIAGGNFIDIVRDEKQKKFWGFAEHKYKKKYIQVGFPGWKKQINPKAVKEILKATKLTAENGVDSKTFFKGAEPMIALIDQYRNPLIRLKDK